MYSLLITIVLSLLNPFNIGLTCENTTKTTQAQFDKIVVQEVEADRLIQIAGEPDTLVAEAIPMMEYIPNYNDYNYDNPYLPRIYSSFNIITVIINIDRTIGEINSILSEVDAEIVGGMPGKQGKLGGFLIIRVPTSNYEELNVVIKLLDLKPEIEIAAYQAGLSIIDSIPENISPQALPFHPDRILSGWT